MTAFEADLDRLHAWLSEAASRGAVPVVCGANGDMDTVASAVALAAALPQAMACGRHLGRLAKRLVEDEQAPFPSSRAPNGMAKRARGPCGGGCCCAKPG